MWGWALGTPTVCLWSCFWGGWAWWWIPCHTSGKFCLQFNSPCQTLCSELQNFVGNFASTRDQGMAMSILSPWWIPRVLSSLLIIPLIFMSLNCHLCPVPSLLKLNIPLHCSIFLPLDPQVT